MRKLRIAVVGVGPSAGSRSELHIETILKLQNMYSLCAFCDRDPNRLKQASETFGVRACYTSLDDMLRQERPDVAYRLTPKDSIGPICMKIADAGVHVLTEIPLAPTLPVADLIIDTCRRNNVKLEVAENVWVWPEEILKPRITRAGMIGKVTHGRFQYPCGTYHGLSTIRKTFNCDPIRALGVDGKVEVFPQKAYGDVPMTHCFWEAGVFQFPNNLHLLYEMQPRGRHQSRFWEIEGTLGHLQDEQLVRYEDGQEVAYPFQREFEESGGEKVISKLWVDTDPPVIWENPFKGDRIGSSEGPAMYGISGKDEIARGYILASMHRAVVEDSDPDYGGANARVDLEAWIAVRESAKRGNVWVDLPLSELTSLEREMHDAYQNDYGAHPVDGIADLIDVDFPRAGIMWDVAGWL